MVYSFGLSIGLWVEGGRRTDSDAKEFGKFLSELRDKLGASIADDVFGESVKFPYIVAE